MNYLLIPMKLRGLLLQQGTTVAAASADFSALPWFDSAQGIDRNPDTPYLAEEIIPAPFQNENLYLEPGFHLHFVLPDTFNRAEPGGNGGTFPKVPNRWYIKREGGGLTAKEWIVESDFLWSHEDAAWGNCIGKGFVTFPKPAYTEGEPPFWYMGRQFTLAEWRDP
jgi:hypothetical protein